MLNSQLICLRALEPEDLESLYDWENDTELWEVTNTRQPYSRFALRQYISQAAENSIYELGHLRLMITLTIGGQSIGTVDLFDLDIHHSKVALGLFIHKDFRGKGFAALALQLIEEYVFDYLKLHQLYCQISANNQASRTMFEKKGYHLGGILKDWIKTTSIYDDILVFQKINPHD
jgi:diamine N-acetyltransferase